MAAPYNTTYLSCLLGHLRSLQISAVSVANEDRPHAHEDCYQRLSRERQQNIKHVRVLPTLSCQNSASGQGNSFTLRNSAPHQKQALGAIQKSYTKTF